MLITSPERTTHAPGADPEALIQEARARQRRRQLRIAAGVCAALGLAALAFGALVRSAATTNAAADSPAGAAAGNRCPGVDLGELAFVRAGALDVVDFRHCTPHAVVPARVTGTPSFSADGTYVSFARGYVATSGGPVHMLPSTPVWAPDRSLFAFTTTGGGIELMAPGTFARRLLPEGWGASSPVWAPGGKTLAVVRKGGSIWVVDIPTGHSHKVLDGGTGQPLFVGFSPNGRWLVYREYPNAASLAADGMALMVVDVSTGHAFAIASSIGRSDFATWCGSSLAYVSNHGGRSVTQGDGIAIAAAPSWEPRTVLAQGGTTSWNALSCASGKLVVSAGPTSNDTPFGREHRSLYTVAPRAGSRPHLLAATRPPAGASDELPMWSAEGRWIAYVRTTPRGITGRGSVYTLDTSTGRLVGPVAAVGTTNNYYGSYGWAGQIAWHR